MREASREIFHQLADFFCEELIDVNRLGVMNTMLSLAQKCRNNFRILFSLCHGGEVYNVQIVDRRLLHIGREQDVEPLSSSAAVEEILVTLKRQQQVIFCAEFASLVWLPKELIYIISEYSDTNYWKLSVCSLVNKLCYLSQGVSQSCEDYEAYNAYCRQIPASIPFLSADIYLTYDISQVERYVQLFMLLELFSRKLSAKLLVTPESKCYPRRSQDNLQQLKMTRFKKIVVGEKIFNIGAQEVTSPLLLGKNYCLGSYCENDESLNIVVGNHHKSFVVLDPSYHQAILSLLS